MDGLRCKRYDGLAQTYSTQTLHADLSAETNKGEVPERPHCSARAWYVTLPTADTTTAVPKV